MRKLLAAVLAVSSAAPALAQEIERLDLLNQAEFRLLSEDLAGALAYRPQTPTVPLGTTGFDLGVGVTAAHLQHPELLERVTVDNAPDWVPVPSVRFHKGLPFGFDAGIVYASVPSSNVEYIGGELRYALLLGGVAAPALGVRASLARLRGVDVLEVDTRGLDISISKGFAVFTPYAGVGRIWADSEPKGVPGLAKEELEMTQVFAGVGFRVGLFNINLEADRTGDVEAFSIKGGLRF